MGEKDLFCMQNPFAESRTVKKEDIINFYQKEINELKPGQKLTVSYIFRESLLIKTIVTDKNEKNEVGDINITNTNAIINMYLYNYPNLMSSESPLGNEIADNKLISATDGGHFWIMSQDKWDENYILADKQRKNEESLKILLSYQKTDAFGLPPIYKAKVDPTFFDTKANDQEQPIVDLINTTSALTVDKWVLERTFITGETEIQLKKNLIDTANHALENLYAAGSELDYKKTNKNEIDLIWKIFKLKIELNQPNGATKKLQEESQPNYSCQQSPESLIEPNTNSILNSTKMIESERLVETPITELPRMSEETNSNEEIFR